MNLVKIADMLKNASDQSLAQEIQNPTGSVPSYMVLSELERRKKLRGSVMQPTDTKSVSEDLGAEFSGIAGLDQAPQDEYGVSQAQPQGYAGGGEVVHASGGWWKPPQDADYSGTDPGYSSDVQPGGLFGTNKIVRPALTPEQNAEFNKYLGQKYPAEVAMRLARGETTPEQLAKDATAKPTAPAPAAPAAPGAGQPPTVGRGIPGAAPVSSVTQPTKLSQEMQDLNAAREAGITGLGQYNDYLKQAIAENKAQKAENAWQAVTMAGLGMLGGRSQFAAENIGQGALMGMQQFTGAEQARQKEGRALAMDMAQSGMKKSDILSNLAKAGFEGKKAEAMAVEALGKGQYYTEAAGVQRASAAAGASGLKANTAKVNVLNSEIKTLENQAKLPQNMGKTQQAAIQAQIARKEAERRQIMGLGGGAAPAAAGPVGGSLAPGQNGRFVYTPGG